MAGILFPDIAPVGPRSIQVGTVEGADYQSPAGSRVIKKTGYIPSQLILPLDFGVVDDDDVAAVFAVWHQSRGGFNSWLILPSAIWRGLTAEELAQIPEGITWNIQEEPTAEGVQPGFSRLRLQLIGELSPEVV